MKTISKLREHILLIRPEQRRRGHILLITLSTTMFSGQSLQKQKEAEKAWELASIVIRQPLVFVRRGCSVACTTTALAAFLAGIRTLDLVMRAGTALLEHLVQRVKTG